MSTTVSYQTIENKLQNLHETTSAQEFGYDLLRIFNAMSETRINRIKDGKDNLLKTENPFLTKKTLAYCWCKTEQLVLELEKLKQNEKVTKAAARLLVVSDGVNVLAYDPKEKESYDNEIAKIRFDYQFFMPMAGVERYQAVGEEEADVKAAYKIARIFDEIRRYNEIDYTNQLAIKALNVFMSRLLFCFFAEDTGIFPAKIFTSSIKSYTLDNGSDLSAFLDEAFDIMSTNNALLRAQKSQVTGLFSYVNGGLFAEHFNVPTLGWKARRLIIECGDLDWAKINPDIFGSMIQAVISPELRGSLGLHYTSVSNIMKVIQPLFLDELYTEFANARNNEKQLHKLLVRISKLKFFDPACGSGNFLIITYKELRKLEILIWKQLESLNKSRMIPFSNIQLRQFYGIEIEEFARDSAILSLWLAEHQMNKEFEDRFQIHVDALPLRSGGNISLGNACRIDWNTVCPHTPDEEVYIMGNPPYLGSSKLNKEQQSDRTYAISNYTNYKKIDYIGIWFLKGAKYIQSSNAKCAFVSTNSVSQGEMVEPLWTPILKLNISINFTHLSFKWSNNAKHNAAVICVIIGLIDKDKQTKSLLYEGNSVHEVDNINPYLIAGKDLIVKKHTKSLSDLPAIIRGCMPYDGGNLILSQSEKDELLAENPSAQRFIKKLFSSADYINDLVRYCLWISDEEREDASIYEFIKQRIEKTATIRLKSPDEGARNLAQRPHQFREFNACNNETLIIPSTSSSNRDYIPMGYADDYTVVTNACYTVFDAPLWLFGIITSKMNMAWVKTVGGKLKSDYRYTNLCYNSFPFPKISAAKRTEIEQAAENVLLARQYHTEKTLAQMYDPQKMPTDLRQSHTLLDRLIESCYRPEPFHSDEERLEHLFALYEKMTKK